MIKRQILLGALPEDELLGNEYFKNFHTRIQHGILIYTGLKYAADWGWSQEQTLSLSAEQWRNFPCRLEGGSGMDGYYSGGATKVLRQAGFYLVLHHHLMMLHDYGLRRDIYDAITGKLAEWHQQHSQPLPGRKPLSTPLFPFFALPDSWKVAGMPVFRHGRPITVESLIQMEAGEIDGAGNLIHHTTPEAILGVAPMQEYNWDQPTHCDFCAFVEGWISRGEQSIPDLLAEMGIESPRWWLLRTVEPGEQAAYDISPTRDEIEKIAAYTHLPAEGLCNAWVSQFGKARCKEATEPLRHNQNQKRV